MVCHGILMMSYFGFETDYIVVIIAISLVSILSLFKRFQGDFWSQARAIFIFLVTAYLIFSTGGSRSFFLLWFFIIIAYYPLILGSTCGLSLILCISLFYLSTLFISASEMPEIIVIARTLLLTFIGALSFSLAKRLRSFDAMQVLATTDGLTGLTNRRYFFELANSETLRTKRYADKLCLIIADINNFKNINDKYGHVIGDDALKLCASLLLKHTRDMDIVCRLGGDEFALLLPSTDFNGATEIINRINKGFSEEFITVNNENIFITTSFGVAEHSDNVKDIIELYDLADKSMYENKIKSKNNT